MDTLARGVAIGFAIAAPIGPISLLCIQRTLRFGFVTGFASGAGAALADALYALLAGVALSLVMSLFASLGRPLHIAGGTAIALLGLRTVLTRHARKDIAEKTRASYSSAFLTSFALTMINPLTILSFAAIVSASSRSLTASAAIVFAVGVGIGSVLWWLVLLASASAARRRIGEPVRRGLDVLSGAVLLLFGVIALFR